MASDSDPLLPKTKPSPEVHDSQPRRFNDIEEINQGSDDIVVNDIARRSSASGSRVLGFCGIALFVFFLLALLPDGFLSNWLPRGRHSEPHTIDERVAAILKDTPLIDGHNDLAILITTSFGNHINNETFLDQFEYGGMPAHVDLPRLAAGQNGGAFWSAFVPCPADGNNFSNENYAKCEFLSSVRDLSQSRHLYDLQCYMTTSAFLILLSRRIHIHTNRSPKPPLRPLPVQIRPQCQQQHRQAPTPKQRASHFPTRH